MPFIPDTAPNQQSAPRFVPDVGVAEDVVRGIPADIKGASSTFGGWPGDLLDLAKMSADYMGLGSAPGQSGLEKADTWLNSKLGTKGVKYLNPLNSSDITQGLDTLTGGPSYQPQTNIGKDVKLAAELLPAMIGGPETVATKLATRVGAPVLAGEAGGQLAKAAGVDENTGRAIGTVVGGPLAGFSEMNRVARGARQIFPSGEELHDAASRAFKAANLDTVALNPARFEQATRSMVTDLRGRGFNPYLSPASTGVVKASANLAAAGAAGKPITMLDVEHLRQQINNLYKVGGSERELAHKFAHVMNEHLDKYFDTLHPGDVLAGNPKQAVAYVKQGRELWGRFRKAQKIENMVQAAEDAAGANYTQAGFQASVRQQARGLLKRIREKREVGWTADEIAALRRAARGDTLANTTRLLGKLAPHGAVSMASGFGLGAIGPGAALTPVLGPVLGPIAGAALTAGGSELFHRGSNALTRAAIEHARNVAASGGTIRPLPRLFTPQSLFGIGYGAAPLLSQQ